ncbi:MAG: hypothetical protein WBA74_12520 [Cyclobacteriaceae bacterium]
MSKLILLIIVLVASSGCKERKSFDAVVWQKKGIDWQMSDHRENMITDLIASDTLSKMSRDQVLELLGKPELIKGNIFQYLVREKYEYAAIDPVYISYLFIQFDESEKVSTYYLVGEPN